MKLCEANEMIYKQYRDFLLKHASNKKDKVEQADFFQCNDYDNVNYQIAMISN